MNVRAMTMSVSILAAVSSMSAFPQAFSNEAQVFDWFTYYYRKPEPTRVAQAVRFMSEAGLFKDVNVAPPVIGFLAGVLGSAPGKARELSTELLFLPEREQPIIVRAIWYSGLADARSILGELLPSLPSERRYIEELLSHNPPRVTELEPEQGSWVMDMLWGFFMATGSEEPVARIIGVLKSRTIQRDKPRLTTGDLARWSLTSNAIQHERVLEICKSQLPTQKPEIAAILKDIIRIAKEQRAGGK